MVSARAKLIRKIMPRFTSSPGVDVETARREFDMAGKMPLAPGVDMELFRIGNQPAARFTHKHPGPMILYIHGGGYVIGSIDSHKPLVSWIVRKTGGAMVFPEYRLAPENVFPAAQDDALEAYKYLLTSSANSNLVVIGDSAGGGLAVSMLCRARDEGLAMPKSLVLFSPWADLSMSGLTVTTKATVDPILSPELVEEAAVGYAGPTGRGDPGLSPLFGDLSGLPNTLIQVGTDEILLDDSKRLAERMEQVGVDVRLDVVDGMWHVYPLFTNFLPEAKKAIADLAEFVA